MELRPDTSHKENVPPRPATPLRPEQRRLLKSLGVGLGRGRGQWVPVCQAKRGGPAATPSAGAVLCQEPWRVQTNLARPSPGLGLALKDTTGRLVNSSFQQQSNLQPLAGRPQRKAPESAVQQSNLSIRESGAAECGSRTSLHLWSEPEEGFRPHMMPWGGPLPRGPLAPTPCSLRQSWLLATDAPCPDFRSAAGYVPLDGRTRPGPRSWCGLGSWTCRLMGEPLTLEDLAVPAQSQAQAPSQAAVHQRLASVQSLEHKAACLGCRAPQEPRGPCHGWALAAYPQPGQPVLASWDKRKKHPRGLREPEDSPEPPGVQAGLSESQAGSKPASPETMLGMLTGDVLDPEQGVLHAHPLRRGGNCSPGTLFSSGRSGDPLLPRGAGRREARLCSSTFSHAAPGVLPGREGGEGAPREQVSRKERTASCLPDTAPPRSVLQISKNKAGNAVSLGPEGARWQLLSGCFRAWRHLVQRRWAVAAAVALGRRQLLRRGLRALRWALWLREAQLEAAWGRHTRALLAQSFHKWRSLTQQQKQRQPHVQAGPGPTPSGGGQGQGLSGRKPAVDPARRSSPGSLREEAGARSIPSRSGPRPGGGDGGIQILQALEQLAVFLLWCHQKGWARQERGLQGEASRTTRRTQRMGRCSPAALGTQPQRAWLCRCFGAWQRLVKRGAQYRDHMANRRAGTLRMCLQRWVQMKHLRASERAKVTQLSLCWQKAGNMALHSSAPGAATAHGLGVVAEAQELPQEQGRGSLQEACQRLALHPVLLLWRTQLSQRQRADSFFQGMRRRMLQRILRRWHLRVWGPGTPSGSAKTTLAPEPLGGTPGGEASLGCSTPRSSLQTVSRAPDLLESLQLSFLWAAGRRQQGRCLLLWQARAQQSRGAARWHQSTLPRRVLLGWSHWATAQGAQKELAARWACGRSCRAALELWRQRLTQWHEVEQCAREWDRRRVRDALRHWHSCWQRQQFLCEKYQRCVQVHLQGLQRAAFQGWQQAAARRRHMVTGPEQHLLQRPTPGGPQQAEEAARAQAGGALCWTLWVHESHPHWASRAHAARKLSARVLEAWAQAAARGRVQRATITQFQQARPRHLLQTHWAQWRTALLRVWLETPAKAQAASTAHPRPRADLRHPSRPASRGRLLVLMDTPTLWKQTHSCRPQATGPMLPGPTQHHSFSEQRRQREAAWAQGDREPPLRHTFQLWLQWPGHSSWAQGQLPTGPRGDCSSETGAPKGKGQANDKRRLGILEEQAQSRGSALVPGHEWVMMPLAFRTHATASPPRRKCLQRWHLEALLRRLQGTQEARRLAGTWQRWVDAQGAEQLARTLLRQWHLRWAWRTWRRRVLQLRGAQRLQQQEDSWVLSQAFEKWHQRLAASGPRRGATSSPRPLHKLAIRSPGSRLEAIQAPACARLGAEQGAQLQL